VAAGVDAMRVVSNAAMHEHHVMDARQELVCTKIAEMCCESIPGEPLAAGSACTSSPTCRSLTPLLAGCILQVYALIQGGSGGKMGTKVLSIVVSALTTGMNSATISCACNTLPLAKHQIMSNLLSIRAHADDFDSDPDNRRRLPSFYGYLPDESNARTIMYV
jgi:hypothetical protein